MWGSHEPTGDSFGGYDWTRSLGGERLEPGGEQYSAVVAVDDVGYVKTIDKTGRSDVTNTIYGIDLSDGDVVWKYGTTTGSFGDEITAESIHLAYPPVIQGNRVFFGSVDGHVYALSRSSGEFAWKYDIERWVPGSPALEAGTVVAGAEDGTVVGLDAQDGDLRWQFGAGGPIRLPVVTSGGIAYVAPLGQGENEPATLYALDASTGRVQWEKNLGTAYATVPTVSGQTVVISSIASSFYGDNRSRLRAFDAVDGTLKWGKEITAPSPVTVDGTVIASVGGEDSGLFAFDLESGTEIWHTRDSSPKYPAVDADSGTLYLLNMSGGEDSLLSVDSKSGRVRWSASLDSVYYGSPSPTLVGSSLLLADTDREDPSISAIELVD